MKLKIEAGLLKEILSNVSRVREEITLRIYPQGISISAMDACNGMMLSAQIPKEAMASYDSGKQEEICFKLPDLLDMLRKFQPKEEIEIEDGDTLSIKGTAKAYSIGLLAKDEHSMTQKPQLAYKGQMESKTDIFKNAVKDLDMMDNVRIGTENSKAFLASSERSKSGRTEPNLTLKEMPQCSSSISMKYLTMSAEPRSEDVIIKLGQDYPITIIHSFTKGIIMEYMIAPRTENE